MSKITINTTILSKTTKYKVVVKLGERTTILKLTVYDEIESEDVFGFTIEPESEQTWQSFTEQERDYISDLLSRSI